MAKPTKTPTPHAANLSVQQMRDAIPRIERRIGDLKTFDVNSVKERNDPRISVLSNKLDTLLVSVFGSGTIEYDRYHWEVTRLDTAHYNTIYETPLSEVHDGLRQGISSAILQLEGIVDEFREEVGDSGEAPTNMPSPTMKPPTTRKVFVVHGHEDGPRESVARFLEQLQFEVIILHEQANKGKTIIEKFEEHGDVSFAVVILTPDDIGAKVGEANQQRARQNVILEWGYFIGRLGRHCVCALKKGDIELPSDILGIVWETFDGAGSWKLKLAKELEAAGFAIDRTKIR